MNRYKVKFKRNTLSTCKESAPMQACQEGWQGEGQVSPGPGLWGPQKRGSNQKVHEINVLKKVKGLIFILSVFCGVHIGYIQQFLYMRLHTPYPCTVIVVHLCQNMLESRWKVYSKFRKY